MFATVLDNRCESENVFVLASLQQPICHIRKRVKQERNPLLRIFSDLFGQGTSEHDNPRPYPL